MDISVVIVNWNTKDLLIECLHSLNKVTGNLKKEIIVVDNGSNDGSQEAVKTVFPEVKIIKNNENLGFAKANNIGMKASTGRYLCLVNSDVKVLDGCLEQLMHYMDQDTGIGIVGPQILWPDMTLQDSCRKFPGLWNNICDLLHLNKLFPKSDLFSGEHMMFFDHTTAKQVEGLAGCFLMIRKSALEQVGMFDEQYFIYFEETDLCKRFRENNWKIVFFPYAHAIHYGRKSSSKDALRFSFEQLKSKIQYWKKHHRRHVVIIILFTLLVQHGFKLITDTILYVAAPSKREQIIHRLLNNYFTAKYILTGKYSCHEQNI
ncbi:MAG: glycosyltransferase family 2 protein [Deltaproteobacteria bacterium]|nr:glycosyltransferase family 2 protein [Deltaproteobacteria bacterium]